MGITEQDRAFLFLGTFMLFFKHEDGAADCLENEEENHLLKNAKRVRL